MYLSRSNPIQKSWGHNTDQAGELSADPALLNHWAWSHRWREPAQSVKNAERAFEVAPPSDIQGRALACRSLAWHALWRGDIGGAREHLDKAMDGLSQRPNQDPFGEACAIRAHIHCRRAELGAAEKEIETGESVLTPQSALGTRVDLLVSRAALLRHQGNPDKAEHLLSSGLSFARGAEMAFLRFTIACNLLMERERKAALEASQIALSAIRRFDNQLVLPYILRLRADCMIQSGQGEQADALIAEGVETATINNDPLAHCQLAVLRIKRAHQNGQFALEDKLLHSLDGLLALHNLEIDQTFADGQVRKKLYELRT